MPTHMPMHATVHMPVHISTHVPMHMSEAQVVSFFGAALVMTNMLWN